MASQRRYDKNYRRKIYSAPLTVIQDILLFKLREIHDSSIRDTVYFDVAEWDISLEILTRMYG